MISGYENFEQSVLSDPSEVMVGFFVGFSMIMLKKKIFIVVDSFGAN